MHRRLLTLFARFAGLFGRASHDADLAEELGEHLLLLEADLRAKGLSPTEARRRAHVALRTTPTTHAVRDARTLPSLGRVWQDLRQSVRSLRRAPVFTLASVLTLAIGIGATTTVFSVVNVSLLKPLPYPQEERLVALVGSGPGAFTGQEIHVLRERLQSVQSFAWHGGVRNWNIDVGGRATSAREAWCRPPTSTRSASHPVSVEPSRRRRTCRMVRRS